MAIPRTTPPATLRAVDKRLQEDELIDRAGETKPTSILTPLATTPTPQPETPKHPGGATKKDGTPRRKRRTKTRS